MARVICGFGIGLVSATVPTYMSEQTIKKTERGIQVAYQCIYLINGVALAYWVWEAMPTRYQLSLSMLYLTPRRSTLASHD